MLTKWCAYNSHFQNISSPEGCSYKLVKFWRFPKDSGIVPLSELLEISLIKRKFINIKLIIN